MNNLKTTDTGGFPFRLDDIRFLNDAYRIAFADIITGIVKQRLAIIHGCDVTYMGLFHRVEEGAIAYAGEVWHVDEHDVLWAAETFPEAPVWVMYEQFDALGNKIFKDGTQHNTYAVRKAKILMPDQIQSVPGVVFSVSVDQGISFADAFLNYSKSNVILDNGSEIISGSEMKIVKTRDLCVLQGQIRNQYITTNGTVVLTIPVGTRPNTPICGYIPLKLTGQSTWEHFRYLLDREGSLTVFSTAGSQSVDMYLSISFIGSR